MADIKLTKRDIEIFNFNNLIRKSSRIVLNQSVSSGGGGENFWAWQDNTEIRWESETAILTEDN